MNKRLVWNFEINSHPMLDLDSLPKSEGSSLRWESRRFWKDNEIITLHGLSEHFLNLNVFKIKQRQDYYFLIPNCDFNIKERENNLFYKPILHDMTTCQAFGKKINLSNDLEVELLQLPNFPKNWHSTVQNNSVRIEVEKVALIYKFAIHPTIKLELARLEIKNTIYFSACIEGHSQEWVTLISQHLFRQTSSCDYVRFLKETQQVI